MKNRRDNAQSKIIVFLCNIRSVQNAGAIMRTADAVGAAEVIFGGYTPGPLDRFGRERKEFTKVSLGAEKSVRWRHAHDCKKELSILKQIGAYIIAVEQGKNSIDYTKIRLSKKPTVVVFGNEVSGLSKRTLSFADAVAEIPMRGKKESLNVSVAAGIVLYRLLDK